MCGSFALFLFVLFLFIFNISVMDVRSGVQVATPLLLVLALNEPQT